MTIRIPNSRSLLLLLFSTLLLSSCITVDKTIGSNLIPTDQDLTLHTAIFALPVDSRPTDSLQMNNHFFIFDRYLPFLFGACYDPLFGLTEAGTVFQFVPTTPYSYGDDPVPVSLTLTLVRQKHIVLSENQASIPQNVFVHEVYTELTHKSAYNNSLEPQDWNSLPISQPGQIYFGTDTLRISLSLDFARELLTATQKERDSLSIFVKRYKGLYIRTETPNTDINSGRLNFIHDASMTLKYTLDGADSTVNYICGENYFYLRLFNTVTHSRSSLDSHSTQNIYYQGLAGHKPYIDFVALTQDIQAWAEQSQIDTKKLLLSRAEMVFSYDSETDYTVIDQYPSVLYPFTRRYADSTSYFMPVENVYALHSDGNINRSKSQYSMNITSYLQFLLMKASVTERDNAWLMETARYDDQTTQTQMYHYVSDSYPLATFKGTATESKPYLKITYSVLK